MNGENLAFGFDKEVLEVVVGRGKQSLIVTEVSAGWTGGGSLFPTSEVSY